MKHDSKQRHPEPRRGSPVKLPGAVVAPVKPLAPPAAPGKPPAAVAAPAKATHWDNVAEWYDALVGDEGSEYHQKILLPGIMRMLTEHGEGEPAQATRKHPLNGLRLLDLACGQGVLCRHVAAAGAKVVGVDAALGLIEAARRRNQTEALPIAYHVGDVTKLVPPPEWLTPASFDIVTVVLAIQNITPLSPVWQAAAAALVPGGQIIVVMMHPCFRVFKQSDWQWDASTQSQGRVVRQYLSSSKAAIEMRPAQAAAGGAGESTVSFNRPLQAYINTLANAGLHIDHMEEWASHRRPPAGVKFEAMERARREIPLFMALRARKGK